MLGVEERFKLGVLLRGGTHGCQTKPLVDEFNFTPRVRVPILMMNGRYDAIFPVDLSQKPIFDSLGTPLGDKKHVLYPGGHAYSGKPGEQAQEVLAWLDRYLGPVE